MRKYKKMSKFVNTTGYTPGYASEGNPMNIIPSEDITMRNTPYPLYGQPLDENGMAMGSPTYMEPGKEYKFGGASYVAEVPVYKDGGQKSAWISDKIAMLMGEGRPQKQAVAIAYSMWNQKHEMGGTQLPMYQFAGTAELDQYGQPLPAPSFYQSSPTSGPTFSPGNYNSWDTDNNGVPDTIQAPEGNPSSGPTFSPGNYNSWDTDNNGIPDTIQAPEGNPLVSSTPDYNKEYMNMAFADEQLKPNDGGDTARKKAETSGMGMTQFINPYGDVGLDDALMFTGKSAANGNVGATVGGAALSLLKGTKSFLQGMGAQKRQNQVMKNYAEEQRKNMTGEGREQSMAYGGYYQNGGRDKSNYEEELNAEMDMSYPSNDTRQKPSFYQSIPASIQTFAPGNYNSWDIDNNGIPDTIQAPSFYQSIPASGQTFAPGNYNNGVPDTIQAPSFYQSSPETESESNEPIKEQEAPADTVEEATSTFDPNSARDNWVKKTGLPWSEARRLGYTTGTAKDNIKLLSELKDPEFKAENLRKAPVTRKPVNNNKNNNNKNNNNNNKTYTKEELWGKPLVNPIDDYISNLRNAKPQKSEKPETTKKEPNVLTREQIMEQYKNVNPLFTNNPYQAYRFKTRGYLQEGGEYGEGDMVRYGGGNTGIEKKDLKSLAKKYNKTPEQFLEIISEGEVSPDGGTMIRLGGGNTGVPTNWMEEYKNSKPSTTGFRGALNKGLDYIGVDPVFNMGGYYQDGGMQPEMGEEQMMMGNPQEEQAGGDQMQAIVQQVAQMLQQGADPQEILQQLVQAGLPEEQAMQVIQMVIEQMQGAQPQATPQLGRGGQMMERADGSYSKRGLWDNIRDNAGSGKKPTSEMLEQERKINARYQEGGEMMDEQMEGETPNMEQIESQVEQALKQGADPEQILEQLVQMGMPEEQAIQMIQEILQEIQGGETEMEGPEQGQPMMKNGGEYLAMMKGKTIKNYTYNKKTGNYDVEFE
jgi:hypothetical protein